MTRRPVAPFHPGHARAAAAWLVIALTTACGAGGKHGADGSAGGSATLTAVSVSPGTAPVNVGLTRAFTATATYSDGSTSDVTAAATWTSSSDAVASISGAVATGVSTGTATITATWNGRSGQATLTVTAAALASLDVSPATTTIAKGLTQAFTATGHYTDGTTLALTDVATWASSSDAVATLSGATATAAGEGEATITASYGGKSGQATLTVTAPALVSIAVSPGAAPVAVGDTQAFTATGHYTDASTQDLTSAATWTSSDIGVASLAGAVATGVGPGTATVTAAYGGKSGQATLVVSASPLVSVEVAPGAPSVPKGLTQAFTATGHYADSSTEDVTALATWTTSSDAIAPLSGATATARAEGSATITATYGGQSGQATLTVGPAAVASVAIDPAVALVPQGLTTTLVATATYTDGSTLDVTATASWSSDDVAVSVAAGVVTGNAQGVAVVTATQDGRSGQAIVTVGAAALQSIAVAPASVSIPKGLSAALAATGHYSDGSTLDLTFLASWSSAAPGVATVDATGLVAAVGLGTTTVSATADGQVGSADVTVTAPALLSVAVAPASPTLTVGLSQPFTATGTYSDGSTQDLTSSATWTSSDGGIATMAGATATGVAPGAVTITASVADGSGATTLTVIPVVLQSVTVAPATVSIAVGLTQTFAATAHYSDGTSEDVTGSATWSVSGAAATMSGAVATGVATGSATVTAAFGGSSGTASLTVTAPVIRSIALTPGSASVAKGLTQTFTATASWSDGTTSDVSAGATWTTDDPAVASATGSVVRAVAVGATQVHALSQGVTGSASLTVTPATVSSLSVTPAGASLAAGTSLQYGATALYTDGTKQDVTTAAIWAASPEAIATISASGLATGVAPGAATVSASWGGVDSAVSLAVTDAVLASISVTPTDPTVPLGVAQPFTATGIFSNGTREDLTTQATWSSSAPSVATISADGVAAPVATGTTTIQAQVGAISGATTLTVTNATLVSVDVTPPTASVAAGTTVQLRVTGLYSDGTTQDLTALASWASASGSVVSVSNAAGAEGLATGVAPGTANVTATYEGASDFAAITVTAATLAGITVTPAHPTLPVGVTQPLTATGTFTDGSTQDLTDLVAWTSSVTTVAAVSNGAGQAGAVTALSPGTSMVTAAYDGIAGATTVTVTAATVASIAVSPTPAKLPVSYTRPFSAVATYTDGSTRDVTSQATWQSSNTAVATVSNASGSQGVATGVATGSAAISATLSGVSGSAALTVTNANLQSIAVTPSQFTVAVGGTTRLAAIGTFNDGSSLDITAQCGWSSSSRTVAHVSGGTVSGLARGSVTITAKKKGKTGSATGTVN